jgi:5'-3' exonuclease
MTVRLIVDGTNEFVRHYSANPALDANGNPFGGVTGFLKSLKNIIELTAADTVIIVFDGVNGSVRRRKLYKEYKHGRKPKKLNRTYELDENDEIKSKQYQAAKLREYLEFLPVSIIDIPDIEADDAIGYLVRYYWRDKRVVASNDTDFYQLLHAESVKLYKPSRKTFYGAKDCFEEHCIHPINFALARACVGDKSDNILGIPGIGLKTLVKSVPLFSEEDKLELDDVIAFCRQSENAKCKLILQNEQLVADNYKIMRLDVDLISAYSISAIKSSIDEHAQLQGTALRLKLMREGVTDLNEYFFHTFLSLSHKQGINKING